jgi:opacity protein-like surface antigen
VYGRILALSLLVSCSCPAIAAADWLVSPYLGARFAGSTTFFLGREGTEDNKFTFGSSIGLLTDGVLGVEADIAFVPGFFEGSESFVESSLVTTVMGNVLIAAPLGIAQYGLRPYVTGGAGLLRARGDAPPGPVINSNLFGMNVGGGAIGPISPRSSLRFDLRYYRNLRGDVDATTVNREDVELSFWRGTVGLTFRF